MIESNDILGLMKVVYVIYLAIVFSMVGIFAYSVTREDLYSIRSTEYSSPRGGSMVMANTVEVNADIAAHNHSNLAAYDKKRRSRTGETMFPALV